MSHPERPDHRETPAGASADDPVFLDIGEADRWLDHEIGAGHRSREARSAGNRRRPVVTMIRWIKRLLVGGVLLVLLLATSMITAVWFSRHWLRAEGERLLISELARQNIHFEYQSASYEFTRGLVLRDVELFETELKKKRLLTCSEFGFSFDLIGYLHDRLHDNLTTSFTTDDATVVCFEDGVEIATIENLNARIIGRPNDVVVDEFRGMIGDLDFELEGRVLATREARRKRKLEEQQIEAETDKPKTKKVADFAFFHELMPWLAVTSREEGVRPEIRAKFVVDNSAESPVTVSGRFSGRNFNWRQVPLDAATIEFAFAEGDERLTLPSFNLIYDGGLITGAGVWDSGPNVASVERFQSAANLVGLIRDINPTLAPFAATLQMEEPPILSATGRLNIKDFWNSDLQVNYRHQSGMTLLLSNGPLKIEGITTRARIGDGGLETDSLLATMLGGRFELAGAANLTGPSPTYRGRLSVSGLPLQAIVDHFGGSTELPGLLSGQFEGGGGIAMSELNGAGSLRIDSARLYKVPVIGQIQNVMGSVVPVFGDAEKRSELTTTFTITNGLLDARDMVVISDGTRVEVEGTLSLSSWQTEFEAQGNLIGALGLVTGLVSKALVVEGSGRVDDLELNLKHVPAEFASETVKGIFGVAKGGVGVVSNTVGAGLEGAQQVAGGAIKATGNVLNEGAEVVEGGVKAVGGGVKAVGDGLEDGARMVGEGAKRLGEGLLKMIPGSGTRRERPGPPDPEALPDPKPAPVEPPLPATSPPPPTPPPLVVPAGPAVPVPAAPAKSAPVFSD